MGTKSNLEGKIFGRLTVLKFLGKLEKCGQCPAWYWECKCSCGKETQVRTEHLRSGRVVSCGCYRVERVKTALFKNLTGKKFGRLTAVDCFKRGKHYYWNCRCDCGNMAIVNSGKLINSTRSCGCLAKEMASAHFIKLTKKQKGENHPRWNHRLSDEERMKRFLSNGKEYRMSKWRRAVYDRDHYTCKKCGDATGHNLNAHHIYSRNTHPNLTYVSRNGITLCEPCHKKFHKIHGYGNNTKKQLTEFMNSHDKLHIM